MGHEGYRIRTVRADDWPALKELRLAALSDPVARVAFVSTYEDSSAQADEFWRGRATPIVEGGNATSLIAADRDGRWVAMLALLDETGDRAVQDESGDGGAPQQMHVVSVYVRPEHRGTGVAERLFRAAVDWSWENTEAERVGLWVHSDNVRARAFYRRIGFAETGETMAFPTRPDELEYEMVLPRP
ncbi:GNAT family N-acetyltransferase [Streptomyces pathocidini]|uniref:GNAT family N-acetyltransferase n=1 Tax=Streptomyces pathocidini TaxID=1650571 RepID=A0ABW7UYW7_9ACTN|nr:GNAT family N-acetyltransferase [Streptomyces pathocidini]